MQKIVISLICAFALASANAQPKVLVFNPQSIEKAKQRIKSGDADAKAAYERLIKNADKALKVEPMTVMDKKQTPPSGDKHDYMSIAPYWWPNPDTKDGLPYVRRDGERNPELKDYQDKNYFPKIGSTTETLALAYYFSGKEKYAEHAAKILRTWFLDPATRMNPNMNYAQAVKGRNDGRGSGLIEARPLGDVVNAVGLLQGSKAWTDKDHKALQSWITEFTKWMTTSPIGLAERHASNNHGVYYNSQCLAFAIFINDKNLAQEVIANTKKRLDVQQDSMGGFTEELGRTCSWNYSHFVLEAFYQLANLSEKLDDDLWNYTSPSGKSLKKAAYFLQPYWSHEKQWQYQEIDACKEEDATELLLQSYKRFGDKAFEQNAKKDYASSSFFTIFELAYK